MTHDLVATTVVPPALRRARSIPPLSEPARDALVRLLVHGPSSRADLARRLRMSAASLTRISRSLEDGGLIGDTDAALPQRVGRPSQAMDVNVDAIHLVGIKLVADAMNLVRTDIRSEVLAHRVVPLPADEAQAVDCIAEAVLAEVEIDPLVASVGISLAGPIDPSSETVGQSPFLGWSDTPLAVRIQERAGLPTVIENDVRALTAAEHWFGAAAGETDFALITVGAGIGCGVVIGDRLVGGAGGAAGQIGHLPITASGPLCERGHRGCARSYLAAPLMVGQAAAALGRPDLTYDELLTLGSQDNPVARRILDDAGFALGTVIGLVACMSGPSRIIVSGEGVGLAPLVVDVIEKRAREVEHWTVAPVPIQIAEFSFLEWARGAAVVALQQLLESSIGLA